jgi:hypothetical protein
VLDDELVERSDAEEHQRIAVEAVAERDPRAAPRYSRTVRVMMSPKLAVVEVARGRVVDGVGLRQ